MLDRFVLLGGEGGKGKKKKNQLALFCDFVALIKRLSDRGEEGTE